MEQHQIDYLRDNIGAFRDLALLLAQDDPAALVDAQGIFGDLDTLFDDHEAALDAVEEKAEYEKIAKEATEERDDLKKTCDERADTIDAVIAERNTALDAANTVVEALKEAQGALDVWKERTTSVKETLDLAEQEIEELRQLYRDNHATTVDGKVAIMEIAEIGERYTR